jgi:hypothetical protein
MIMGSESSDRCRNAGSTTFIDIHVQMSTKDDRSSGRVSWHPVVVAAESIVEL